MKRGDKVEWKLKTALKGHGVVISDEVDGHVQVAVESDGEVHHVIWCATTWLTVLP